MGTPKDSEKTRAKIIEAAGQLFTEKGYTGVTVREIVKKAKMPLGAMNYHFRSKEALYREVLLEACRKMATSKSDRERLLILEPREALRTIITEYANNFYKQHRGNWEIRIIMRESGQPSDVFMDVAEAYCKPEIELIAGILGKIVNKPAEAMQVRFAVMTLLGLMDTFNLYEELIDVVAPGLNAYLNKKETFIRQIYQLVLEAAKEPMGDPGVH